MKLIPLTQGKFAMVDDDDFEWLNQWKWCAIESKNGNVWYAVRNPYINGKYVMTYMHKVIMGDNPLKLDIDHRFGNGLDNQIKNLRFCTRIENSMNSAPNLIGSSKYKGVCLDKRTGKWSAGIAKNGKIIAQKRFINEIDAAKQYDSWAKEFYGEFAKLNFPEIKPQDHFNCE
jgi:hypothetical protein